MAITRAQQVRQMLEEGGILVSPSMDGKRKGYRFGFDRGKETKADKGADKGDGPTQSQRDTLKDQSRMQQNQTRAVSSRDVAMGIGSKQKKGTVTNPYLVGLGGGNVERDTGLEKTRRDNITIRNQIGSGMTKVPPGIPGSTAINFLQNLLSNQAIKNRKFALDMAMKNRAFFRNNPLLAGGKTIYDLTEDEREDLIDQYYDARSSNLIDATGNIIGGYMGPDGQIIKTGRDDDQILFPQGTAPGDPNQDPNKGDDSDDDDTQTGSGLALRFRKDGGRIGADKGGIMMASAPDPMDTRNDMMENLAIDNFGKPLKDLTEDEIIQIEEMMMEMDQYGSKPKSKSKRAMAQEGGMMDSPVGGIMDLESARQMYGLGKLVKKATRAIKKITKSPLGKAAILGGALYFGGGGGLPKLLGGKGLGGFSAKTFFSKANPLLFSKGELSLGKLAALSAASPFLFQEDEEEDQTLDRGPSLDIARIRNNPYDFLGRAFVADGGIMRLGYQEGSKEPVAKKTMPLLDMGGKEMDLRDNGGFVPIGRMEKADDVPARLSKNEFVFTAEAVRNAGEGDVDKGAEVMYNMMKNLEAGGEVSEESQGLEGAREMFQTSKRLEEVL